jgi:hypothetical protein
MPPKNQDKKGGKPSASKVVADKTFGMKNKKGGKAQRDIQRLQSQMSTAGTPEEKRKREEKARLEREKKAAEDARRETAELFKPAQSQKVPFGVDPKTVVCVYFKKGFCEKGRCRGIVDVGRLLIRAQARSASLRMTWLSRENRRRRTCMRMLGVTLRRRILWRTGTRRSFVRL